MPANDEITLYQSFSERTLKYGRNMMAAAAPIIVFEWVPRTNSDFQLFFYKISAVDEIWVWQVLFVVLIYYAIRFYGLAVLDYLEWKLRYIPHKVAKSAPGLSTTRQKRYARDKPAADRGILKSVLSQRRQYLQEKEKVTGKIQGKNYEGELTDAELRAYHWQRAYFWITDLVVPTELFLFALYLSLNQIYTLAAK